jgi:hypothetical protein
MVSGWSPRSHYSFCGSIIIFRSYSFVHLPLKNELVSLPIGLSNHLYNNDGFYHMGLSMNNRVSKTCLPPSNWVGILFSNLFDDDSLILNKHFVWNSIDTGDDREQDVKIFQSFIWYKYVTIYRSASYLTAPHDWIGILWLLTHFLSNNCKCKDLIAYKKYLFTWILFTFDFRLGI